VASGCAEAIAASFSCAAAQEKDKSTTQNSNLRSMYRQPVIVRVSFW
jgi:hypothetical protein